MSQPTQKPGIGKHKSRGPDFICKPRFRNTLPDLPFPGKFLPCPFVELERFIDYKPTSLEMEYKFEVQCEMDMGLNLDLIDPNTYKVDPNVEIQLNEKDSILLEDEDSNAKQMKRSAQHSKVVPWMRKTQYISSEFNRFGIAADRQEIKVGYNLTKNKENLNIFRDRQSQINLIKKSFEESKAPIRKHFTKKGVTAIEEIPILPDFELWKFPFALVQFDADPSPVGFTPELRDSMVTQSHIKGMQDDDGEQFVAYFLPTVETLQKKLSDKEEGRRFTEDTIYEYVLNREYTWTVKNKNTKGFERDNFFVYYKDGWFHYNELETKVRLVRRRRPVHEKPNTRLHVTYTDPSEAEIQQMTARINSLLKDCDSDDEIDKPSDKSDSDGGESNKKSASGGSDDSNNESVPVTVLLSQDLIMKSVCRFVSETLIAENQSASLQSLFNSIVDNDKICSFSMDLYFPESSIIQIGQLVRPQSKIRNAFVFIVNAARLAMKICQFCCLHFRLVRCCFSCLSLCGFYSFHALKCDRKKDSCPLHVLLNMIVGGGGDYDEDVADYPRSNLYTTLDCHRTLWMGDLQPQWDAQFISTAFKELGHSPSTVKMVTDKHTGVTCAYCFVEFATTDEARDAMLRANGHKVPNSEPRSRFNLSFANDPRVPSIEFNLFVNNIHPDIDDAALYQVFGARYRSCRGAKVYRNRDGSSRCLGFIRFGDQTEQQMALVEMNKTVVRGREMLLKLAAAKQRLPRHQIRDGIQPQLIADPSLVPYQMTYQQPQQQSQVTYAYPQQQQPQQQQQPVVVQPSELVYPYNPTAEEANADLIENGDAWWEVLEESRWSACIVDPSWTERELCLRLNDNKW
ncbi:hypothetical protein Angca_006261 [Angiostrongylus cantonensis]|nr:hypothetical protein Angca_006261 [Angiostrongylus cantonensis]